MVSVLERSLTQNGRPRRATAQGIASLCIGGMVVARALVDPALADELRDASMAVALDLGGWSKHPKSKNGKFKAAAHPQSNEAIARDIRTPPTSIFLRPRR